MARQESLAADAIAALDPNREARGSGHRFGNVVAMLAKAGNDFARVGAQMFDCWADSNVQTHPVGRYVHLDLRAGLRVEERAPVIGDRLQAATLPGRSYWRIVGRAEFLPVAAQAVAAQLPLDKPEGGVDGEVEVPGAHLLGIGVRQ